MSIQTAAAEVGKFLLENPELVEDAVELIKSGVSKDAIRQAIRDLKVKVSDAAMREELGLPPL